MTPVRDSIWKGKAMTAKHKAETTAEELKNLIETHRNCFAVENHQGCHGPAYIDDWPVPTADECAAALENGDHPGVAARRAIETAWLSRGDHEGLPPAWVNGASCESCDLPDELSSCHLFDGPPEGCEDE